MISWDQLRDCATDFENYASPCVLDSASSEFYLVVCHQRTFVSKDRRERHGDSAMLNRNVCVAYPHGLDIHQNLVWPEIIELNLRALEFGTD